MLRILKAEHADHRFAAGDRIAVADRPPRPLHEGGAPQLSARAVQNTVTYGNASVRKNKKNGDAVADRIAS